MPNPTWTDDEDNRLMELWREHNSMQEIANSGEFQGRSRNACIGRLVRLRKKWGIAMVPPGREGRLPIKPAARKKRRRTNFAVKAPFGPVDPTPIRTPLAPPDARRIPLLELGPKDCRFIVTDHDTREHLYCATPAGWRADDYGNNCYCNFHWRIMRAALPGRSRA